MPVRAVIPRKIRHLVYDRAEQRCERCGAAGSWTYSVHHRRPRGMGGSKNAATNSPSNLVLLCGSGTSGCHGEVESDRWMAVQDGLIVPQHADPATTPVLLARGWTVLTDDGCYIDTTDGESASDNACAVGEYEAAPPSAGNTQRGLTTQLDTTETGRLLPMMMHHTSDRNSGARREAPKGALSVVTTDAPDLYEWRARTLLALAILNHRRTREGLTPLACEDMYEALTGHPHEAA